MEVWTEHSMPNLSKVSDSELKAADVIEKNENRSKHIVIMAHGFVNRLLRKELLRRKWRSIYRMGVIHSGL